MEDFLDTTEDMTNKPAEQKVYTKTGKWFKKMLSENKRKKQELAKTRKNKNDLEVLKANLEFMEKWNKELEKELTDKKKKLDELPKLTSTIEAADAFQAAFNRAFKNK